MPQKQDEFKEAAGSVHWSTATAEVTFEVLALQSLGLGTLGYGQYATYGGLALGARFFGAYGLVGLYAVKSWSVYNAHLQAGTVSDADKLNVIFSTGLVGATALSTALASELLPAIGFGALAGLEFGG